MPQKRGPPCILWGEVILTVPTATPMDYIIACPNRELLAALCAFADHLATLPAPRGVRQATLLVALAGGATAWRLWLLDGTSHRACRS